MSRDVGAVQLDDAPGGRLRSPTGELRMVMCRACGEEHWTKQKRYPGRCAACRRLRRPSTIVPKPEFQCERCRGVFTGDTVYPRRYCDPCFLAKERERLKLARVRRPEPPPICAVCGRPKATSGWRRDHALCVRPRYPAAVKVVRLAAEVGGIPAAAALEAAGFSRDGARLALARYVPSLVDAGGPTPAGLAILADAGGSPAGSGPDPRPDPEGPEIAPGRGPGEPPAGE